MIMLATDGGCYPNPGPGGWAWVADDGRFEAGSFSEGTNNIAELTAIERALLAFPDEPLHIQYDSQYAVNCITMWGPSWRRKGIRHKANIELIYRIMDTLQARPSHARIKWEWVPGHDKANTYPLNTAVDLIATRMTEIGIDGHHETGVVEIDWEPRAIRDRGGRA